MATNSPIAAKTAFYNLRMSNLGKTQFFSELAEFVNNEKVVTVNFLNAHCFNIAQEDPAYREALDDSTFLLNDGIGIDVAGRIIGTRFEENLNGTDLIPQILAFCARRRMSVFLYGAKEGVAESAAQNMQRQNPDLRIAGVCHGFVTDPELVIQRINNSAAEVVILGLGVPLQELWVHRYSKKLPRVRLLVCGGAILDFQAGRIRRAPSLLRKLKLEWLFRLAQEPRRLFSRYILGSFMFLRHILVLRR